jgi:hypothetical protein
LPLASYRMINFTTKVSTIFVTYFHWRRDITRGRLLLFPLIYFYFYFFANFIFTYYMYIFHLKSNCIHVLFTLFFNSFIMPWFYLLLWIRFLRWAPIFMRARFGVWLAFWSNGRLWVQWTIADSCIMKNIRILVWTENKDKTK